MTMYHFHLYECGNTTTDIEGIDCVDDAAARTHAMKSAREVMCSEVLSGRLCLACYIRVCDSSEVELFTVPFREAIQITGL